MDITTINTKTKEGQLLIAAMVKVLSYSESFDIQTVIDDIEELTKGIYGKRYIEF